MADIAERMKTLNKYEKTQYLKGLTAEQQQKYKRYMTNERQKKYKQDKEKKELANERSRLIMFVNRETKPEYYKEQNKKHNKTYNDKKKQALKTIADAIKAKKARDTMRKAKADKAKQTVKSILNDIIDTIPKKAELKKKAEYMRQYRAKKKAK